MLETENDVVVVVFIFLKYNGQCRRLALFLHRGINTVLKCLSMCNTI